MFLDGSQNDAQRRRANGTTSSDPGHVLPPAPLSSSETSRNPFGHISIFEMVSDYDKGVARRGLERTLADATLCFNRVRRVVIPIYAGGTVSTMRQRNLVGESERLTSE